MNPLSLILALMASGPWAPPQEGTSVLDQGTGAPTVEAPSDVSVTGTAQDTTLVIRRVWSGDGVDYLGEPTPDGSHLTFDDWSTNNLAIRDMGTGNVRNLTHKEMGHGGYPEFSVVSPDGRRVAYNWYPGGWVWDLRMVDIDGSNDRVLVTGEDVVYVVPRAWSPDGTAILAIMNRGGNSALVLVSPDDGSIRVLEDLGSPGQEPANRASFSPDGQYVVFDRLDPKSSHRDIFLLSVEAGRAVPLVMDEADDQLFGWVHGSDWVLFGSDRTGTLGAWAIRVVNGRSAGDPVLVKPDMWRSYPVGFSADGSFYYGVDLSTVGMYLASIDPETGDMLSEPTRLDANGPTPTRSRRPVWSPDGRYLAYWKTTEPSFSPILEIRSMETGETRELRLKFRSSCLPRWSPDGLRLLCGGREPDRPRALYSVDVQTGAATLLRSFEDGGITIWYDWAPDGKSVYYKVDYGNDSRIVHLDPATGAERVLRADEPPNWISIFVALSPDGKQLAFWETDAAANKARLLVMPTTDAPGTEVREISSTDGQGRRFPPVYPLQWSRDGRYVLHPIPEGDSDSSLIRVWRVPVSGGAAERTNIALRGPVVGVALAPDGRRLVYESGKRGYEVWVMKNYLPRN